MFKLVSSYKITSAQASAAEQISRRFRVGKNKQVLLGVTGSGKTYVMANVIHSLNLPTLIISPNKTLAAQLYQEFKGFFPHNRVGYFISYYDYYQPEAYIPRKNIYIAKEVSINPELERLRMDAISGLLATRYSVVVASASAIYNIGSPGDFKNQNRIYALKQIIRREALIQDFVALGYTRTEEFILNGTFRVRGDVLELFPTNDLDPVRVVLTDGRISEIIRFDAVTGEELAALKELSILPISCFFYKTSLIESIVPKIKKELQQRILYFQSKGQIEFAARIKERTMYDIELLTQFGYCTGIENYSMYIAKRKPGDTPYTLFDYLGDDYLIIIDESHITVPQLKAMHRGDFSRKKKLVDYGFRLPSAFENRPLNFAEIEQKIKKVLYVSATPAEFELQQARGNLTELFVRPTGLLDPLVEVRKIDHPVRNLTKELDLELAKGNRVLVTTLTKNMAEKLTDYLNSRNFKCAYLHSEIKPFERVRIVQKLQAGEVDILIGINLLREGLDIPQVGLVVILDADKEGYLRSKTSLIQTFGRASRNLNGRVILYAQQESDSLNQAISESKRRREYQKRYNAEYHITPRPIVKKGAHLYEDRYLVDSIGIKIDEKLKSREDLDREVERLDKMKRDYAQKLDFKSAAAVRDKIRELKNIRLEYF